ncbi:MAG: hypothetical protein JRG91_15970 [Deltaproteobacteria bacterium]|nr:hypothetical protein [Deltaproteobacteria bacterium]
MIACSTEFKKDGDGGVDDALDIATEAPADGTPDGGAECGNGDVDDGEQCDDGNDVDGDGCDGDCTYSCEGDGDCLDDNPCNGEEICDVDSHACDAGVAMDDGYLIDVGPPRIICLSGNEAESVCGDGFVDEGGGEFCEPPGEGTCTDECLLGCSGDDDCVDDGVLCNGEEFCDAGLCGRRNVPESGTACNDELYCTTDEACDGAGTCTGGDPTCDDALACTDDRCDESTRACDFPIRAGNCLMSGECYVDHDRNPANDCEECDSSREFSLWIPLSDGTTCADDGAGCTDDVCASGACDHPLLSSWCYMGGACIAHGTRDSGNECLVCDSTVDPTAWTTDVGYSCDDGDSCTTGDECDSTGACVGTSTSTFSGASQVTAGFYHTCAIVGSGLSCWGYSSDGQLGDGSTTRSFSPVSVTGLSSGVVHVGAGMSHTCAAVSGGAVKCWGNNSDGQIGNGTSGTDVLSPADVVGLSGADQVCGGFYHSCARLTSGQVRCWGRNTYGELGNGTSTRSLTPVGVLPVTGSGYLGGVLEISCGNYHNCARLSSGQMVCWGFNGHGQSGGDGSLPGTLTRPVVVRTSETDSTPLSIVDQIALGGNHTCAVMRTGNVKCWGYGINGELGDGDMASKDAPVYVMIGVSPSFMLASIVEVSGGSSHTCALATSGNVVCWGSGAEGQLGNGVSGTGYDEPRPVFVQSSSTGGNLTGVSALDMGSMHSVAIANSPDNVIGWGRNNYGQLGIGTYATPQLYPEMVGCP